MIYGAEPHLIATGCAVRNTAHLIQSGSALTINEGGRTDVDRKNRADFSDRSWATCQWFWCNPTVQPRAARFNSSKPGGNLISFPEERQPPGAPTSTPTSTVGECSRLTGL
jgi:hypothetical protein